MTPKYLKPGNLSVPTATVWRWGGISSVYPKSHSCGNGHHAQDINFVGQLINTDSRTFVWEKNKPYIVITGAGCYWWRWGGISSVYPKSHSCGNGHHAQDINFVGQLINTDSRTFVWEKNKPYIVITGAGCYWVKIGAFASKSSSPPSLQITIDEEPVALFNSSGKSPTSYKISVTSSAPKSQSTPSRHRSDVSPWRPGSSLSGAILVPGHSRLGIWAASTVSGTRLAVEGYLEIHKVY
ncbi:hypothetical protein AC249_AIPGENE10127 [Exaiptasia diaphana]|nr:hypothetical protein AC249_AIPGENE10127 [Exaiptasia diaphana]